MPSIRLEGVSNYILNKVDLEVRNGEFMVLFGPNGSGKTTLLNVIAGLGNYTGSVFVDGICIDSVPPTRRGIGYVFQNLVLFPHLDVASNVAFGLKTRWVGAAEAAARVKEMMNILRVDHLHDRYPGSLSGGEKQRVALARALAPRTSVLLMDEPLSSLDLQTAKHLRTEFRRLQKCLGLTTVYVTHNLEEAEELADRITVLSNGRIMQTGRPWELFFCPGCGEVADMLGRPNIFECDECNVTGTGIAEVSSGGIKVIVPHDGGVIKKIAILPRDVYVSDTMPSGPGINRFKGVVAGIEKRSGSICMAIRSGHTLVESEIPVHIYDNMSFYKGGEVFFILKLRRIRVLDREMASLHQEE